MKLPYTSQTIINYGRKSTNSGWHFITSSTSALIAPTIVAILALLRFGGESEAPLRRSKWAAVKVTGTVWLQERSAWKAESEVSVATNWPCVITDSEEIEWAATWGLNSVSDSIFHHIQHRTNVHQSPFMGVAHQYLHRAYTDSIKNIYI